MKDFTVIARTEREAGDSSLISTAVLTQNTV